MSAEAQRLCVFTALRGDGTKSPISKEGIVINMNQLNQYRGRENYGSGIPSPADEMQERVTRPCPGKPIPYMPEHAVPAMAYVPMQEFDAMYPPMEALTRGTAFLSLDLPFMGKTIGGHRNV